MENFVTMALPGDSWAKSNHRCDAVRRLESGAQESLAAKQCFAPSQGPSSSNSHRTGRKFQKPPRWGLLKFVASEGFEPPKAEPSDLQSDPFGR